MKLHKKKIKRKRSWRKLINSLLVAVLLVVFVFLSWINAYYHMQSVRQVKEINENALALWIGNTETRLTAIHEHINEILLTIYNTTVVTKDAGPMSFQAQTKCQKAIDDKLQISGDADCFFLLDTETDWFVFKANTGIGNSRILNLKAYARNGIQNNLTGLHDKRWYLTQVDDEVYFAKGIAVGKYIIGSMCRVLNFDISDILSVVGTDSSCLILYDDAIFFAGGQPDWSEYLSQMDKGALRVKDDIMEVFSDFSLIDSKMLLVVRESILWSNSKLPPLLLFFFSLICVSLIVTLTMALRHKVQKPTNELLIAHQEIQSGNIQYRIRTDPGSSEFNILFESFNNMAEQIQNLRIESYDRLIRDQANRLQMVRAQIKPHFYLNAITTVYNMTYQNRLDDIRTFVQALAKYMRYMLNIQSEKITIAEELSRIESYLQMQELQFPGSVNHTIDCPENVGEFEIPFLILLTLVENAVKHALNLYRPMQLDIKCELVQRADFRGCRMIVQDNGDGFPEEVLEEFATEIPEDVLFPKEHLGLTNIRYTLQLAYHRQDLLRLSNTGSGARAEIWIPNGKGPCPPDILQKDEVEP